MKSIPSQAEAREATKAALAAVKAALAERHAPEPIATGKHKPPLSAGFVQTIAKPGRYLDGDCLWLQVAPTGTKSWLLIYKRHGKQRWMGLGGLKRVSLKEARVKAKEWRLALENGDDPITLKRAKASNEVRTFKAVALECIEWKRPKWKNAKHATQWLNTLTTYAFPSIGNTPVRDVTKADVVKVLRAIWNEKPETASRVRQRIETVLAYAMQHGDRPEGINPAAWAGLSELLAKPGEIKAVEHHAALHRDDLPKFMAELRSREGISARALEFAVLTAARTSEVTNATWAEIDLNEKAWIVPASRMKSKKEHRVPLSRRAVEILRGLIPAPDTNVGFVFPGGVKNKPITTAAMSELMKHMRRGVTVHGTCRSTFKDWAADCTNYGESVSERALAHAINDKTQAAYERTDLFTKRINLMRDWESFCSQAWLDSASALFAVVPIAAARKAKATA